MSTQSRPLRRASTQTPGPRDAAGAAGAAERRPGFRAALRYAAPALLGYLAVRAVGVLAVVVWGTRRDTGGLHRLATMWDAYWYQDLAQHGYAGSVPLPGPHGAYEAYAFFPLYPALIRLTDLLTPFSVELAALLVAWAASLVAAWGIFAVGAHLHGRRTGVLAAVLWGVLPLAVVESAAYSEPLFTAFAAWAVYAAVRRRWVPAGALTVLAGLTRPTGLALAAAVSCAALWELLARRGGWRAALGAVLAPLGFFGFLGWVGAVKGSWDAYFRVQDAWESHFDFGRSTFESLRSMLTSSGQVWLAEVVVAGVLAASVVLFAVSVAQRQPPVLLLYSAALLVLALGDAAYFNSRARFLIPAFGLLLPAAAGLARIRSRTSLVMLLGAAALCSAVYGGFLVFVYTNAS
ncbi:glycosyltransferase 87 family protein [Kitasatospora sp. NPDC001664]|uniref:glycosyltransferase 87 family protein n=1 Tax=Kitasatospora albolonga TaxID=68173 RepID=UPI0031F0AEC5